MRLTIAAVAFALLAGCGTDGGPGGRTASESSAATTRSAPMGANAAPGLGALVDDGPPPPPTSRCLPETPVELEVGPWLLGCMITPTRWTVENTGPTIAQLTTRQGTPMPWIYDITPPGTGPASMDDVLTSVYARYRTTYDNGYFLMPGDKISVLWPGDTPGELDYTAAAAESVGLRLALEGYNRVVSAGRRTSAADVIACIGGAAETASRVAEGSAMPTTETWNVVVDDGFNVLGCAELVPEEERAAARQRVRAGAVSLFDEFTRNLGKWFRIVRG